MGTKIHKVERTTRDPGRYEAVVTSVEPAEGQFGEQFMFRITLDDGQELRAWCSAKLSDKSKLGRWVAVLLGSVPADLDTDDLIGRPCCLNVSIQVSEKDGSEFNRIDSLAPSRRKVPAAPVPVAEPEESPF